VSAGFVIQKRKKKGKRRRGKENRKRKILFSRVRRRVTGALIDNELSKIDGSSIDWTGRNTFQRS